MPSNFLVECSVARGAVPLKRSNLSTSNPKYLDEYLFRHIIQTFFPSRGKGQVPGQDIRPNSLMHLLNLVSIGCCCLHMACERSQNRAITILRGTGFLAHTPKSPTPIQSSQTLMRHQETRPRSMLQAKPTSHHLFVQEPEA